MRATGGASALGPSSALANETFLRCGLRSQVCIAYVCALKASGRGPGCERMSSSLSSHAADAKPPAASGAPGAAAPTAARTVCSSLR